MNHPTDPMTPVRALLDTVHDDPRIYGDPVLTAARAATASISQLLSEHDAYCKHQKAAHAAYDEYKQRKYRNETPERIGWAYSEFQSQACKASLAIVEGK